VPISVRCATGSPQIRQPLAASDATSRTDRCPLGSGREGRRRRSRPGRRAGGTNGPPDRLISATLLPVIRLAQGPLPHPPCEKKLSDITSAASVPT
jgi:hypothetical protein